MFCSATGLGFLFSLFPHLGNVYPRTALASVLKAIEIAMRQKYAYVKWCDYSGNRSKSDVVILPENAALNVWEHWLCFINSVSNYESKAHCIKICYPWWYKIGIWKPHKEGGKLNRI